MPCHSKELCHALKLQNNEDSYQRMRKEIIEIAARFLSLMLPCGSQLQSVKAIKEELIGRWPDFFGGNDNDSKLAIGCAMKYIKARHSWLRSKNKVCTKRVNQVATIRPSVALSKKIKTTVHAPVKQEQRDFSEPPPSTNTQIPLVERMTQNLYYYSTHCPSRSQPPVPTTPAPSRPNRTSDVLPEGGLPSTTTKGSKTPTTTPLPIKINLDNSQRSSQPSQSLSQSTTSSRCQVSMEHPISPCLPQQQAVRCFLQTCLPPMDHFLSHFINAGMRTEESLLAASKWRPELIESFLDKLPPHADGSPVLLVEKLVLRNQFETYFL